MLRIFFAFLVALFLVQALPVSAEEPSLADPFAPPPLSTKIWDDFSVSNLSSKAHKALGYATVTLGVATGFLAYADPASRTGEGPHHLLGQAAAIAAGATLLAGLVAHWKDLKFSQDWVTWNNLHAATGIVGASLMVTAALLGGQSSLHAWAGAAGTGLMALAIVLEG